MSRREWSYHLSELRNSIDQGTFRDAITIASPFIKNIKEIQKTLLTGCGYYTLQNIPIDTDIPPPPANGLRPYIKGYISEHAILGITGALGYNVFSYQQEKKGSFVHEITPTIGNESKKSSNGIVNFAFHTDAAYLHRDLRPETLTLLCLKNESTTGTYISSLKEILNELSTTTIDILKSDKFRIRSPDSFDIKKETCTSLLREINGITEIQLSIEVTTPLTDEATKAIKEISEAANDMKQVVMWEPGTLLIFNNRTTLHGRGKINGSRWLQRCYGSRLMPPCTVIDLKN